MRKMRQRMISAMLCLAMVLSLFSTQEIYAKSTLDSELTRIKSYQLVKTSCFRNLNKKVTAGEYYDTMIGLLKKIDKKKVSDYKSYFKKNFDRSAKIKQCDAMFMAYLAMFVTGYTYVWTDNWDAVFEANQNGFDGGVQDIYSKKINDLETYKDSGIGWGLETRAYFATTQAMSPIVGKAIFDIDAGKKSAKFSAKPCTNEIMIRSVGRLYEYLSPQKALTKAKTNQSIEKAVNQKIKAILENTDDIQCKGTVYYVSNDGDDSNDGKSPETAWKTLEQVKDATLQKNDTVLFRRGDVFRGSIWAKEGVSYGAYGTGSKPVIQVSPYDGADPTKWKLYYSGSKGEKIWKYTEKTLAIGNIFFDGYSSYALKYSPYYYKGSYYVADGSNTVKFNVKKHLKNLEFFTSADKYCEQDADAMGDLYLRCDKGNPGKIYKQIEFAINHPAVFDANGCSYKNLCFYSGQALTLYHTGHDHLTYENCEVAYMGGCVCGYDDVGFPLNGGDGMTMGGNYNTAKNNYVHDCMDHGCTLELTPDEQGTVGFTMNVFSGNVIENCNGGFLFANWFCSDAKNGPKFNNITISDNYVVRCGYGFGETINRVRQNEDRIAAIDNGGNHTYVKYNNVKVTNNTFYLSKYALVNTYSDGKEQITYDGNVYANYGLFYRHRDQKQKWTSFYGRDTMSKAKKLINDKHAKFILL